LPQPLNLVSQAPAETHICLSNVAKTYGTGNKAVKALSNISLDIARGEFLSILGPSGCGKSTLLMMIAGLISASEGYIEVDQRKVCAPLTDVGIAFQRDLLFDWRTVLGNVMLQADMRGLDKRAARARALMLLEKVGLSGFENRRPWELSGGMKQRVALCRSLVHEASLLLMDEPFGALDALTRDQINLHLQTLWLAERRTAIMITHSISEAIFLSDRVVVLSPRPGRVVCDLGIDLPRPRTLDMQASDVFARCAKQVRSAINHPTEDILG
jgi:NitT/TauT family transport system ATP-binding protein